MNKSTFVGAVGSITIYQGTREESCPPLYSVIGKQTLILAVELVEQQTCPSLSGHGQEKSWQVLTPTDTHGWKKLVEVQPFWGEIPACYWRGKMSLDVLETEGRTLLMLLFFPKTTMHQAEPSNDSNLSHRGIEVHWVSTQVQEATGEIIFSPASSRVLKQTWMSGRRKEIKKETDKGIKRTMLNRKSAQRPLCVYNTQGPHHQVCSHHLQCLEC